MWVFEELVNGQKLSEIINTQHENVKYLPGKKLPKNVVRIFYNLYKTFFEHVHILHYFLGCCD